MFWPRKLQIDVLASPFRNNGTRDWIFVLLKTFGAIGKLLFRNIEADMSSWSSRNILRNKQVDMSVSAGPLGTVVWLIKNGLRSWLRKSLSPFRRRQHLALIKALMQIRTRCECIHVPWTSASFPKPYLLEDFVVDIFVRCQTRTFFGKVLFSKR